MNIVFQLIELPENEQVVTRQISLPSSGGTIGRSYECTIQLPDHSRTLSRVHIEVRPQTDGSFLLIDRSVNGCQVNGVDLGVGQSVKLNDGDTVRIGGYLMLVSNMDELFAEPASSGDAELSPEPFKEAAFDFDSVVEEPTEAMFASDIATSSAAAAADEHEAFSTDNVLGEDLYSYDPFEDDEQLSMHSLDQDESDKVVMLTTPSPSLASDESGITVSNSSQVQALDSSIARLTQLVEHQQSALTASVDRERLFSCIEVTLDKFLADFSPASLEEEFNDYISGWGNKDKKYWTLYKKQFLRKQQKQEFKRQFTALLLEELREK